MKERLFASGENGKENGNAKTIGKKGVIVLAAVLVALLLLGAAAYAATVLTRRAEPYEIHHKVEGYEYDGGLQPKWYLESRILAGDQEPVVTIYPEGELLKDYPPNINYMDNFSNFSAESIYYLLWTYPTPNVRKVENATGFHYYVLYMTEKGARYYLFYDERGFPYGYPVYLTAWHEYREFSGLNPGDPIEKVEKIDGTASVYRSYFRTFESVEGSTLEEKEEKLWELNELYYSYPLAGVHYLKDGLLEIRYEFDESGGYRIKSMHFDPDYVGIVPELELFEWPDLSMWSEDSWDEVTKSYEEQYSWLVNTDYSYRILPADGPDGEIVIADVEPATEKEKPAAEDMDWSLPVTVKEAGGEREMVFTQGDFRKEEIQTVLVSRWHKGKTGGSVETIFAGGIPLTKLAEKAGAADYRLVTVTVEGGEKMVFRKEELLLIRPVVAWIQNKKYAMDDSETGLSLAVPGDDAGAYRFTVSRIEFMP